MIGTTREEIRAWLTTYPEKPEDATHMVVVHDEFDHDCYPAYIRPGEHVQDKIIEVDKESLHEVMEVYAFHLDIEQQLRERRSWHPESAPPSVVPDPSIVVAKAPGRKPPDRPQDERPGCATQKAAMALPVPPERAERPLLGSQPQFTIVLPGCAVDGGNHEVGEAVSLALWPDGTVTWSTYTADYQSEPSYPSEPRD
jgi:hypothetical protein